MDSKYTYTPSEAIEETGDNAQDITSDKTILPSLHDASTDDKKDVTSDNTTRSPSLDPRKNFLRRWCNILDGVASPSSTFGDIDIPSPSSSFLSLRSPGSFSITSPESPWLKSPISVPGSDILTNPSSVSDSSQNDPTSEICVKSGTDSGFDDDTQSVLSKFSVESKCLKVDHRTIEPQPPLDDQIEKLHTKRHSADTSFKIPDESSKQSTAKILPTTSASVQRNSQINQTAFGDSSANLTVKPQSNLQGKPFHGQMKIPDRQVGSLQSSYGFPHFTLNQSFRPVGFTDRIPGNPQMFRQHVPMDIVTSHPHMSPVSPSHPITPYMNCGLSALSAPLPLTDNLGNPINVVNNQISPHALMASGHGEVSSSQSGRSAVTQAMSIPYSAPVMSSDRCRMPAPQSTHGSPRKKNPFLPSVYYNPYKMARMPSSVFAKNSMITSVPSSISSPDHVIASGSMKKTNIDYTGHTDSRPATHERPHGGRKLSLSGESKKGQYYEHSGELKKGQYYEHSSSLIKTETGSISPNISSAQDATGFRKSITKDSGSEASGSSDSTNPPPLCSLDGRPITDFDFTAEPTGQSIFKVRSNEPSHTPITNEGHFDRSLRNEHKSLHRSFSDDPHIQSFHMRNHPYYKEKSSVNAAKDSIEAVPHKQRHFSTPDAECGSHFVHEVSADSSTEEIDPRQASAAPCSDLEGSYEVSRIKADSTEVDLQSCQVCGDVAAGFHCGANVCEACKKFFVRCIRQEGGVKFQCHRQQNCHVMKETRTQCQFCRFQKCLGMGMYKPGGTNISSEIGHIPCKVCGAPSSGYHFGAITCEGCKGFFRRTIKERDHMKYRCSKGKNCAITMATRNMCKQCRYQKCLDVGMKPDGSRIGRQPNSIRHATLMQLQTIKTLKGIPMDPSLPVPDLGATIKMEPSFDGRYGQHIDSVISGAVTSAVAGAAMELKPSDNEVIDADERYSEIRGNREENTEPETIMGINEHDQFIIDQHESLAMSNVHLSQIPSSPGFGSFISHHTTLTSERENMFTPPDLVELSGPSTHNDLTSEMNNIPSETPILQNNQESHFDVPCSLIEANHPSKSPAKRVCLSADNITDINSQSVRTSHESPSLILPTTTPGGTSDYSRDGSTGHSTGDSTTGAQKSKDEPDCKGQSNSASTNTKEKSDEITPEEVKDIITKNQDELLPIRRRNPNIAACILPSMTMQEVWGVMMGQFEQCAMAMLKFSKKIPGFRKFPIDQQISHIQMNMFSVVLAQLALDYNVEKGRYSYFCLEPHEEAIILQHFPSFRIILPEMVILGKKVKNLELNEAEMAFLCSMVLVCEAKDGSAMENLTFGLQKYLKDAYNQTNKFGHILLLISQLKRLSEIHQQAVGEIMSNPEKYKDIGFPQLFKETFCNDG